MLLQLMQVVLLLVLHYPKIKVMVTTNRYMSTKMQHAQTRYPVHHKEMLAIITALQEWRHYLHGVKFTIETDHKSLIYIDTKPTLNHVKHDGWNFYQNLIITLLQRKVQTMLQQMHSLGVLIMNKAAAAIVTVVVV